MSPTPHPIDHLRLLPARPEDAARVITCLSEERHHLGRWLPWAWDLDSVEARARSGAAYEASVRRACGEERYLLWDAADELCGEFTAWVSPEFTALLSDTDPSLRGAGWPTPEDGSPGEIWEVAFWLRARACGRGLATRALSTLLTDLLARPGCAGVLIRVAEANLPAARLAARVGAHLLTRTPAVEGMDPRDEYALCYFVDRSEHPARPPLARTSLVSAPHPLAH